jgi:hypothetical protein
MNRKLITAKKEGKASVVMTSGKLILNYRANGGRFYPHHEQREGNDRIFTNHSAFLVLPMLNEKGWV